MGILHPLTDFEIERFQTLETSPRYWYCGRCPLSGQFLSLPRTARAEAIAHGLMRSMETQAQHQKEGKMYGVLLVETPQHDLGVLKAFSGLLEGQAAHSGWVPPIPGRLRVSLLEKQTLRQLEKLKQEMIELKQLPDRQTFEVLSQQYVEQLQTLSKTHRERKQARDHQRKIDKASLEGKALEQALQALVRQSQQDGIERRQLKRERDRALEPLKVAIVHADQRITELKRQRKRLSQQLQAQMHAAYTLTNFAGETASLQELEPTGLPTGTGECAAPKLLHYAATHGLKPVAMAEFWWGPASGDKQPGKFYEACTDRCQPIMGFLLSGLSQMPVELAACSLPEANIPTLYEDEWLWVVDKPSGLLSVPGRTHDLQDSVLSRLRCQSPQDAYLATPHRLDKGTSGILLLVKTREVHRALNQQFAQRKVGKVYEAILSSKVDKDRGIIDLPLWRDLRDRPKQSVNLQKGKPSLTEFEVLESSDNPRVRFMPHTGRTHQLRVHAAHATGLNAPILGDTLYGTKEQTCRLHLHAKGVEFVHPATNKTLKLESSVPF